MTFKAIETRYKGYRFRSRLEARWAVFFDEMGIRYEYEPQGFEISACRTSHNTWRYLPDFHLTDLKTWVEIKGSLDVVEDDYFEMIAHAVDWGGQLPDMMDSHGSSRGLVLLGDVPQVVPNTTPAHVIIQHGKGGWMNTFRFVGAKLLDIDCVDVYFDSSTGSSGKVIKQFLNEWVNGGVIKYPCFRKVADAYLCARMARFEHGETPTVK